MRFLTQRAITVTFLVSLALCSAVAAEYEDELADEANMDDRDVNDQFDPAIVAQCSECVHQQGIPDDRVEEELAKCMVQASNDPEFECDGDGRRAYDGGIEQREWFFKKIKSWFKRNRERIRRAIRKAACIARCFLIRNRQQRGKCIVGCWKKFKG